MSIVDDLLTRHECTAGFTRDIYLPEERDLDVRAAHTIEALTDALRVLWSDVDPDKYTDDFGVIVRALLA